MPYFKAFSRNFINKVFEKSFLKKKIAFSYVILFDHFLDNDSEQECRGVQILEKDTRR